MANRFLQPLDLLFNNQCVLMRTFSSICRKLQPFKEGFNQPRIIGQPSVQLQWHLAAMELAWPQLQIATRSEPLYPWAPCTLVLLEHPSESFQTISGFRCQSESSLGHQTTPHLIRFKLHKPCLSRRCCWEDHRQIFQQFLDAPTSR